MIHILSEHIFKAVTVTSPKHSQVVIIACNFKYINQEGSLALNIWWLHNYCFINMPDHVCYIFHLKQTLVLGCSTASRGGNNKKLNCEMVNFSTPITNCFSSLPFSASCLINSLLEANLCLNPNGSDLNLIPWR